jgi:hypothetical protein
MIPDLLLRAGGKSQLLEPLEYFGTNSHGEMIRAFQDKQSR